MCPSKSYCKWTELRNIILFSSSCCTDMFFYSSHSIVEIQLLLYRYFYRYFVGILPESRYFYWHFIGILGKFVICNIFETPLAALLVLKALNDRSFINVMQQLHYISLIWGPDSEFRTLPSLASAWALINAHWAFSCKIEHVLQFYELSIFSSFQRDKSNSKFSTATLAYI